MSDMLYAVVIVQETMFSTALDEAVKPHMTAILHCFFVHILHGRLLIADTRLSDSVSFPSKSTLDRNFKKQLQTVGMDSKPRERTFEKARSTLGSTSPATCVIYLQATG